METKMGKVLRTASLKYDRPSVSKKVIEGMESGLLSTHKACVAAKVPLTTFLRWVADDQELAVRYARAREILIEGIAAEIMEISDEALPVDAYGKIDGGMVQKQKLQIDTRRWLLSKLAPKKYGDKVEVDHTGAVKIDTITRRIVDTAQPVVIDQNLTEHIVKSIAEEPGYSLADDDMAGLL